MNLFDNVVAYIDHSDRRRKKVRIEGRIVDFSRTHAYGQQACIKTADGKVYWVMEDKIERNAEVESGN